MAHFVIFLHVAFGAFMSYIFTPTLTKDKHARIILERLFSDEATAKEKAIESLLLMLVVFAGGYLAFVILEPSSAKNAVTAGLGWTSSASVARTSIAWASQSSKEPAVKSLGKKKKVS